MNFGVEVAMTHGYLEAKNEQDPCRDKIYPVQNVQNLPQAVALTSLNILKKSFSSKILGYIPTKVVPTVFLHRHDMSPEN